MDTADYSRGLPSTNSTVPPSIKPICEPWAEIGSFCHPGLLPWQGKPLRQHWRRAQEVQRTTTQRQSHQRSIQRCSDSVRSHSSECALLIWYSILIHLQPWRMPKNPRSKDRGGWVREGETKEESRFNKEVRRLVLISNFHCHQR